MARSNSGNDVVISVPVKMIDEIINEIVDSWRVWQVVSFLTLHYIPFRVNSKNSEGRTALAEFVYRRRKNKFRKHDKTVMKALLEHGANPLETVTPSSSNTLIRELFYYREPEMVILFLSYVENIDCYVQTSLNLTPLHMSTSSGLEDVLRYVLTRNPNLNHQNIEGLTAYHMLAHLRDDRGTALAKILLEKDENFEMHEYIMGLTPIMSAIHHNRIELVELFIKHRANLEARDNYGTTPILLALFYKNIDMIQLLLTNGANLMAIDVVGRNAFHCFFNFFVSGANEKMFELLLNAGCNINQLTVLNGTPLHEYLMSCSLGNNDSDQKIDYLEKLIKNEAVLNIQDVDGNSELHLSAINKSVSVNSMIYLMKNGADVSLRNRYNETFFDILLNIRKEDAKFLVGYLIVEERVGTLELYEEIYFRIRNHEEMLEYKNKCENEADILNTSIINEKRNSSLLQFFLLDNRTVARFCEYDSYRLAIQKFDPVNYPIYGKYLAHKFNEALKLYRGMVLCSWALVKKDEILLGPETETTVIDLISNKQLERIVETYENCELEDTSNVLEFLKTI